MIVKINVPFCDPERKVISCDDAGVCVCVRACVCVYCMYGTVGYGHTLLLLQM